MSGSSKASGPPITNGFFAEFKEKLLENDPSTVGIVVAVFLVLLTTLLIALWSRRRNLRRGILILGPCDSGKTTMLGQLLHGKPVETYTSMVENTGSYFSSTDRLLHLIDIPGHERVREALFDKSSSQARGIVYVIDSGTVSKQVRDVAEFLFKILSSPVVDSVRPSVLVVCNKQDQPLVKGSEGVKALLEKEMTNLRIAHSRSLEGTDGENIDHVFLGKEGKDFEFRDLKFKVEFCEANAMDAEGLSGLKNWLDKLA